MAITRWEPFRGLERWEPFREVEGLRNEMSRLFERLGRIEDERLAPISEGERFMFVPSAEMKETPEGIHLKLEIPGLEAKDLDIEVTEQSVSISGERKSETKTEEEGMVRSEFRYGKFQRIIPLPARVQNNAVNAEYKDGILTLTLPKAEEEKNKTVKVSVH
ncbi:MAG: Hsp20/alpha crystallin family protein [Gloeobacterales cyanobacterium]